MSDIILLLINSFFFYGVGYNLLLVNEFSQSTLAQFTMANAGIHLIVAMIIYRQKSSDPQLFYFVAGLVLVFTTIAVPIQFEGDWVSLLWMGEAVLLFWVGRTKDGASFYEKLSYLVMVVAAIHMFVEWTTVYPHYYPTTVSSPLIPIVNAHFLTSILFSGAFGYILYLDQDTRYTSAFGSDKEIGLVISYCISGMFVISLYLTFLLELQMYWDQLYTDSKQLVHYQGMGDRPMYNRDLLRFKSVWMILYSFIFAIILIWANIQQFKRKVLGKVNEGVVSAFLFVFLIWGLWELGELRESYLGPSLEHSYHKGSVYILIRYIAYVIVGIALFSWGQLRNQAFMGNKRAIFFDGVLYLTLLWIFSSELYQVLRFMEAIGHYQLSLSILWGVWALGLILLGVRQRKKHLRVGAIALFIVTLGKVFLLDFGGMDTIGRTVVLISLGILLLLISFMYNKYKELIQADPGE